MEIIALILFGPIIVGAALAAIASAPLLILIRYGLVIPKWQTIVCSCALALSIPIILIWQNHLRYEDCVKHYGLHELSCGGELGGVMLDFIRYGLIVGIVLVGPWIVNRLHRWTVTRTIGK